jgi:hypothetical protein
MVGIECLTSPEIRLSIFGPITNLRLEPDGFGLLATFDHVIRPRFSADPATIQGINPHSNQVFSG